MLEMVGSLQLYGLSAAALTLALASLPEVQVILLSEFQVILV